MKDCRYRLPCNWCDKHNRMCDEVLFEIHKQEQENTELKECEHEWIMIGSTIDSFDVVNHYTCSKCGIQKSLSLGI